MKAAAPDTVLVVDDNEAMLHVISRVLQGAGLRVLEATNGAECLEKTRLHRPELVLLDVRLPDINGVEVLRRIKGDPELSEIFVVHLSAQRGDPEQTLQGLSLGADGYIAQPVDHHELLIRVQAFIRHKKSVSALRESEARYRAMFEHSPQPMWIYCRETGRILAVNNAAVQHYGFSKEEFVAQRNQDLTVWPIDHPKPPLPQPVNVPVELQHRKRDGTLIYVLVVEQEVRWNNEPARVALILDVTERKRAELESGKRLQQYEAELRALTALTPEQREDRTSRGGSGLRESRPTVFLNLQAHYERLITRALEEKIFKMPNEVSPGLEALAERLAEFKASPRDVIEIHHAALKRLAPSPAEPKAQGYLEVGRLTIVELMGHLVSVYRDLLGRTASQPT
jgi:PAS domain S-box-containing protein